MSEQKPLTLEELRRMELEPVWLVTYSSKNKIPRISQWALVASASNYSASFVRVAVSGRMEKKCEDYGKTWVAFAHEPPRLDRSAWEPCEHCKPSKNPLDRWGPHQFPIDGNEIYCYDTDDGWEGEEINFCPWCSRPLTDTAWEILEKRLEGRQ